MKPHKKWESESFQVEKPIGFQVPLCRAPKLHQDSRPCLRPHPADLFIWLLICDV